MIVAVGIARTAAQSATVTIGTSFSLVIQVPKRTAEHDGWNLHSNVRRCWVLHTCTTALECATAHRNHGVCTAHGSRNRPCTTCLLSSKGCSLSCERVAHSPLPAATACCCCCHRCHVLYLFCNFGNCCKSKNAVLHVLHYVCTAVLAGPPSPHDDAHHTHTAHRTPHTALGTLLVTLMCVLGSHLR